MFHFVAVFTFETQSDWYNVINFISALINQ